MAVIVGTDSYVTEDELTTYAGKRGVTITGDKSILLIRAMDYIETRPFNGTKTSSTQSLQFPRDGETVVPNEIKNAQMIAAILIGEGYDLQETIGQAVKREKVDVIEVEYQDGTKTGVNQFQKLDDILRPFISPLMRFVRV